MKKIILVTTLLTVSSTLFAYRAVVECYGNGKLYNIQCITDGGNCLDDVIIEACK
jgi:hypothetical protein